MPWGLNDATVVVDGPALTGWSAIMGRLTVAGSCTIADWSTTIAIEATWWWELAFLAFLQSRLFLEEEGPSSLLADDESAPFCLENLGALPIRFIADILSATWDWSGRLPPLQLNSAKMAFRIALNDTFATDVHVCT